MDDPTRSWGRIAARFILVAAIIFGGAARGAPSRQEQPESPQAQGVPGPADFSAAGMTRRLGELRPLIEEALGESIPGPLVAVPLREDEATRRMSEWRLDPDSEVPEPSTSEFDGVLEQIRLLGFMTATVLPPDETIVVIPDRLMPRLPFIGTATTQGELDRVLVHEAAHVYQERRYPWARRLGFPEDAEAAFALRAVTEGHASYVEQVVAKRLGIVAPATLEISRRHATWTEIDWPRLEEAMTFPYQSGRIFFEHVATESSPNEALEHLLLRPPWLCRQVTRPAEYLEPDRTIFDVRGWAEAVFRRAGLETHLPLRAARDTEIARLVPRIHRGRLPDMVLGMAVLKSPPEEERTRSGSGADAGEARFTVCRSERDATTWLELRRAELTALRSLGALVLGTPPESEITAKSVEGLAGFAAIRRAWENSSGSMASLWMPHEQLGIVTREGRLVLEIWAAKPPTKIEDLRSRALTLTKAAWTTPEPETGRFVGTVVGDDGLPVGAPLTVIVARRDAASRAREREVPVRGGRFLTPPLAPGNYTLRASASWIDPASSPQVTGELWPWRQDIVTLQVPSPPPPRKRTREIEVAYAYDDFLAARGFVHLWPEGAHVPEVFPIEDGRAEAWIEAGRKVRVGIIEADGAVHTNQIGVVLAPGGSARTSLAIVRLPVATLRVVDDVTGEPVPGAEAFRCGFAWFPIPRSAKPGLGHLLPWPVAADDAGWLDLGAVYRKATWAVRSEQHCWATVDLDPQGPLPEVVRLQPGGALDLEVARWQELMAVEVWAVPLEEGAPRKIELDESGRATLPGLPTGRCRIEVRRGTPTEGGMVFGEGRVRISKGKTTHLRITTDRETGPLVAFAGSVVTPASWKDFEVKGIWAEGSGPETRGISPDLEIEREGPCRYRFRGLGVPAGRYRLSLRDPPSSAEVEVPAKPGPIVWTIPERVQIEVTVVDTEGKPVPAATVDWSALMDDFSFEEDELRSYPRPLELSWEPATVDALSGRATLTVVPWDISIEVEAPGYVSSSSQVRLGGAASAEHAVRLVKAGYLVVRLNEWEPWGAVTLLLTRVGEEEEAPDRDLPGRDHSHTYRLAPGRYVIAASDPALESPVRSEPLEVRAGATTEVTLVYPGTSSAPPVVAETRGHLLQDYVRRVLKEYGIADKLRVRGHRIISDDAGDPLAVAVHADFLEKEGYRFADLLRLVRGMESRRRGVRVAMLDFGRKDPGSKEIWRPLALEVVHTLPSSGDATEPPNPLPSLVKVVEDHHAVLEGLHEAGLIPKGGATRLSIEIGPTSQVRWLMTVAPTCDLDRLRAAFVSWPGFRELRRKGQQIDLDAPPIWDLLLTWSP